MRKAIIRKSQRPIQKYQNLQKMDDILFRLKLSDRNCDKWWVQRAQWHKCWVTKIGTGTSDQSKMTSDLLMWLQQYEMYLDQSRPVTQHYKLKQVTSPKKASETIVLQQVTSPKWPVTHLCGHYNMKWNKWPIKAHNPTLQTETSDQSKKSQWNNCPATSDQPKKILEMQINDVVFVSRWSTK